jgi:hypothetical protein
VKNQKYLQFAQIAPLTKMLDATGRLVLMKLQTADSVSTIQRPDASEQNGCQNQ